MNKQRDDAEVDADGDDDRHLLQEPAGEPPPLLAAAHVQPQGDQQAGVPEVHWHDVQREAEGLEELHEPERRGHAGRRRVDEHFGIDHGVAPSVGWSSRACFVQGRVPVGRGGLIVIR